MFQDKVIVITGGAGSIGKCITNEFQKQGAHVFRIYKSFMHLRAVVVY